MYARYRIWWHAAFWVSFYVYRGLLFGYQYEGAYQRTFTMGAFELPLYWLLTYSTIYWLIPKYLKEGKYIRFCVYVLGVVLLTGTTRALIQEFVIGYLFFAKESQMWQFSWESMLLMTFNGCFFVTSASGMGMAAKLIKDWYLNQEAKQQLEQETMEAELNYLKAQVNPHFLFNTLNNLHRLTMQQSRKSPEVVMRLSQLMHYMLYDSNHERVPLDKEIEYLRNYTELERLRFDERLSVSFLVKGNTQIVQIAPLLLQPFVENAFRQVPSQGKYSWLSIEIVTQAAGLTCKIESSKPKDTSAETTAAITNTLNRLALIYPKRHSLKTFQEEETNLVIIKIETDDFPVLVHRSTIESLIVE